VDVGRIRGAAAEDVTVEIHCVTKWSKLETGWEGVSVDTLLDGIETQADWVTAFADGDYTTNMGLEEVTDGRAGSPTSTTVRRWTRARWPARLLLHCRPTCAPYVRLSAPIRALQHSPCGRLERSCQAMAQAR
jgi:hypothetical protein